MQTNLNVAAVMRVYGVKEVEISGKVPDNTFTLYPKWWQKILFKIGLVPWKRFMNARTTLKRTSRRRQGLPEKYMKKSRGFTPFSSIFSDDVITKIKSGTNSI